MIIKKREMPISIRKMQALLRRLPPNHPKITVIKENLAKRLAGYKGENSIDYPLSFLPGDEYFIFHDIRLALENRYFQLDILLISRKFIVIIEVKNIAGTLFFDQVFNQLIRTHGGEETAFPDPLVQIQRHESQIREWLQVKNLATILIISLVMVSNPSTIIRTAPEHKNLNRKVVHRDILPSKIKQFEVFYPNEVITEKELRKLIRLLKKHHTPADYLVLEHFQIKREELLKGVHCPQCEHIPLDRIYNSWFCPRCNKGYNTAHLLALQDYSLLIKSTITNSELREFLQIKSAALATRLLLTMNLTYSGEKKGRIYFLDTFTKKYKE